jgi:hypothetical protein
MNTTIIINKISKNPELVDRITNHYEGFYKIRNTSFEKFCNKNYIDVCPSLLFDFFDTINLKVAIIPSHDSDSWTCRIFTPKNIIINEYESRKDATLNGLNKVIDLYINGYDL